MIPLLLDLAFWRNLCFSISKARARFSERGLGEGIAHMPRSCDTMIALADGNLSWRFSEFKPHAMSIMFCPDREWSAA